LHDSGSHRPLTVTTTRHADRCVIAPIGDLELSSAERLEVKVRAAEASDVQQIIIDLSGVSFMDSTGLRLLLQADARSRADSNRLRLIRGSRRVQTVFELTNTEDMLPFVD
jgi:anti-sigma B factor antagonist